MAKGIAGTAGFVCPSCHLPKRRYARDLCGSCYSKARSQGFPDRLPSRWDLPDLTIEERFWANTDKDGPIPDYCPHLGACWLWLPGGTMRGWGCISTGGAGKSTAAYRFAYELLVGPIPEGLVIDHLCYIRLCVNPSHLEAVTHAENARRSWTHRKWLAARQAAA